MCDIVSMLHACCLPFSINCLLSIITAWLEIARAILICNGGSCSKALHTSLETEIESPLDNNTCIHYVHHLCIVGVWISAIMCLLLAYREIPPTWWAFAAFFPPSSQRYVYALNSDSLADSAICSQGCILSDHSADQNGNSVSTDLAKSPSKSLCVPWPTAQIWFSGLKKEVIINRSTPIDVRCWVTSSWSSCYLTTCVCVK